MSRKSRARVNRFEAASFDFELLEQENCGVCSKNGTNRKVLPKCPKKLFSDVIHLVFCECAAHSKLVQRRPKKRRKIKPKEEIVVQPSVPIFDDGDSEMLDDLDELYDHVSASIPSISP
eukprot:946647_1